MKPQTTDLRSITRRSDRCLTTVTLHLETRVKWLVFGESNIQYFEGRKSWLLKAYLISGVTDFEHDSAYALRLPLIGFQLDSPPINYHSTNFVAWVDMNEMEDFRVPRPGYDPMNLPGTSKCRAKECKGDPHLIVAEGHYAGAPFDLELFKAVRGKRVDICISPADEEEEAL